MMEGEGIEHFQTAIFENCFKVNLFSIGDSIATSSADLCRDGKAFLAPASVLLQFHQVLLPQGPFSFCQQSCGRAAPLGRQST